MVRDLLSSRWFQGGLVFFVLVVGGSLLYSCHTLRTTESELARHDRFLQGPQNPNATRPAETANVENGNETAATVETPTERDANLAIETEPALPSDSESQDAIDAFLPADFVSEEAPAEDGPVSPFGFGPYPDVPADFRVPLSWNLPEETLAKWDEDIQIQMELMGRVFIKLWNQGHTDLGGGTFENGLVLPLYPRTAYVLYEDEWTEEDFGDSHTTTVQILADSSVSEKEKEQIRNGETPTGIRILDYQLDGINPYTFLDLPELK